ncbi:MAG TPA: dihydrolipoamide acetyltransferase family protein [Streptosporangiaceae bacterium]|jgi:2-oxoisovalerate dehydrogenase E2 component (dihydrolipoyl transacylase)|nr:dihydrolipoamide acetyltransferase family protein [Streptosporangiaceae bacterium]
MPELKQFKLPDVGEGLTEADIVKWLVQPGDAITINQIIVEIETAKALVELPSPYEGVVQDLLVPEGETADVGTPIISVNVGAEAADDGLPTGAPEPPAEISPAPEEGAVEPGIYGSPAPKEERQAVLVGYGVKLGSTKRRVRKPGSAHARPAGASAASSAPANGAEAAPDQRVAVLAKPPVRKLAKDLGVDLSTLSGTGPSGSITRDDIQAAAGATETAGQAAAAAPSAGAAGLTKVAETRLASLPREERIAIRGVRKHTAAAMTKSAFTAPHVTEFLQIDITETMTATARLKSLPEFEGVRVSPLLLVAKALLVAASRHPMINSSWDEAAQEIVIKHYVNLGIAAATDRGLVVPSVKDAHALTLPELAQAINQLAETARAGRSTPADLSGGTITITNVGVFGVDSGTPIITPGEAAILAFGQVKDAPWVVDGQLAVRKVCTLSLSFDHRIVDGDMGSAVLREVGAMLTDPLRMLAWS